MKSCNVCSFRFNGCGFRFKVCIGNLILGACRLRVEVGI
jgi:hypothetical protein